MYSINYLNTTGCSDYVKPIDAAIWTSAMMNEAQSAPTIFSDDFFGRCYTLIIEHFGRDINSDINVSNALEVYNFLVNNM